MAFLKNVFGGTRTGSLRRLKHMTGLVTALESETVKHSDGQLPEMLRELRSRALKKRESLEALLPETFALVRETARRVLKERPFEVQVMGGIALHEGKK